MVTYVKMTVFLTPEQTRLTVFNHRQSLLFLSAAFDGASAVSLYVGMTATANL